MIITRGQSQDLVFTLSQPSALSPADNSTIYGGLIGLYAATEGLNRVPIPRAGVIRAAYLQVNVVGTLGTSEASTVSIRLNATSDTTISNAVTFDAAQANFSNTSLSIAVSAGDTFEIKWVTPTWTTNPTTVYMTALVYMT